MDSVNTASAVEFPAVTSDTADAVRVLDAVSYTHLTLPTISDV